MKTQNFLTCLLFAGIVIIASSCCQIWPKSKRCPAKPKVSPTTLDFGLAQDALSFGIMNDGGSTVEWQATKTAQWFDMSQSSGSLTTETQHVEVRVDQSKLSSGTNTGDINISANGQLFVVKVIAEKIAGQQGLKFNFSSMYIVDDYEGGEGNWRIKIDINGEQVVYIPNKEAGKRESVNINKVYNTPSDLNRVEIHCKVHEKDASEWEYVGEGSHAYTRSGNNWPSATFGEKKFKLHNDEGKVELIYTVSPL
jgi:hypothetical protein